MSRDEGQLPNWACLLPELLQLISGKVEEIGDYIRFRGVCGSWREAANSGNRPPQFPWLLLPYDPNDTVRRFWSRPTGRIYRFDLPIFSGRAIYTSSHGWLLLVDKNISISLFHPFTQASIHLPTLPSHPINRYRAFSLTIDLPPSGSMLKCYLFMSAEGKHTVALMGAFQQFLYWREQDNVWITTVYSGSLPIRTVTYYDERFYSLDWSRRVAACRLGHEAQFEFIPSLEVGLAFRFSHCYLVGVADMLLLILFRYSEERWSFDCYKLDDATGQPNWTKIQDIGEQTLFLTSKENSVVAAAGEASGCKRNLIFMCEISGGALTLYEAAVEDGRMQRIGPLDEEFGPRHWHSYWFMPTLS